MFFILHFFLTQRADSFVRFLIWSNITPCFDCHSMITKLQFCHGGSVPDVVDLVKVYPRMGIFNYLFDILQVLHMPTRRH